jgi:hypothetical protein
LDLSTIHSTYPQAHIKVSSNKIYMDFSFPFFLQNHSNLWNYNWWLLFWHFRKIDGRRKNPKVDRAFWGFSYYTSKIDFALTEFYTHHVTKNTLFGWGSLCSAECSKNIERCNFFSPCCRIIYWLLKINYSC